MTWRDAPSRLLRAARIAYRLARLGAELLRSARCIICSRQDPGWLLCDLSRRLLNVLGVRATVIGGPVPAVGMIVCNHLSYLDILVLASAGPAVFVAKSEVKSWPVFGWFARRVGTIFVVRERATSAAHSAREISRALNAGHRVVLFPEGTSSGGNTVLPFKSSLLKPAAGNPVWAAALDYALEAGDGDPTEEVCYWKDMSLAPHLIRLLGKRSIRATVVFAPLEDSEADRKTLARRLHTLVFDLKLAAGRGPRSDVPTLVSATGAGCAVRA